MKYLITSVKDGSIIDFGYFGDDNEPPEFVIHGLQKVGVKAITVDMMNGTRVRYEP